MRILFICGKYPESLFKDLVDCFYMNGHEVSVATLLERRNKQETRITTEFSYDVLRVKTGNVYDGNSLIEKFISISFLPYQLLKAIKQRFKNKIFDLIIAHAPYLSNPALIHPLKKFYDCPALLFLWDLFPQNAADLGFIKSQLLFRLLKQKEKKMHMAFDYISCISKGNEDYIKKYYPYIPPSALQVNYNSSLISPIQKVDSDIVRKKHGYTPADFICVFGGNIGKPQKIENIVALAEKCQEVKFLFIGRGTEKKRLEKLTLSMDNVNVLSYVPADEYELIISSCDVGLVSLAPEFTVPNFPSKTVSYMKCGLPIFALLDSVSACDYGVFLSEEAASGSYALAAELESVVDKFKYFIQDKAGLKKMRFNSRYCYEKRLDVNATVNNIMLLVHS